jgi:hypothetical protein
MKLMGKRGQVAIYVIIAIVIVGIIVTFFAFRGQIFAPSIPAELKPVFDYYALCIEEQTREAISLAESQGGHVETGEYIPGSDYAPFSSQLNFLGFPVPYWYYLTGNGLIKESVPTKSEMGNEISTFVEERLNANCNFDAFYAQGFDINMSQPSAKTTIQDAQVVVDVNAPLTISKGGSSAIKTTHSVTFSSKLGKLYNTATSIYDKEKTSAFLENYSTDVLMLYAPVDGAEISCSGRVWKTREVVDELKSGLEANIAMLKLKGDYYTLANKENNYFVIDMPTDEAVNFLYSRQWPTKIEIFGADNELMIAEPVGTQEGMGVMGFCYAPYHFVYDVKFPVMVQVLDGNEIFQFPVVVIIDKNMPRQGLPSTLEVGAEEVDICQFKTQDVDINIYDTELNKVDANLSYICFNQQCNLGSSEGGEFIGKAPACLNGYLRARANGYAEKKQLFSTNEEVAADVILDREYDVNLELEVGGEPLDGTAIVTFTGARAVSTALPDAEKIKLSEGLYNVTVYAYGNSSVTIPSSTKTQCTETAREGLLGLFGATQKKCFDITIPETKLDYALIGGGKSEIYILPSDLEKGRMKLKVDSMPMPSSIDELQNNYQAFDGMGVALSIE